MFQNDLEDKFQKQSKKIKTFIAEKLVKSKMTRFVIEPTVQVPVPVEAVPTKNLGHDYHHTERSIEGKITTMIEFGELEIEFKIKGDVPCVELQELLESFNVKEG